jgi:hypothetical protein
VVRELSVDMGESGAQTVVSATQPHG